VKTTQFTTLVICHGQRMV